MPAMIIAVNVGRRAAAVMPHIVVRLLRACAFAMRPAGRQFLVRGLADRARIVVRFVRVVGAGVILRQHRHRKQHHKRRHESENAQQFLQPGSPVGRRLFL
jgi:hypothetical protein